MRAVLPRLREQKSGHILNLSSVGGFMAFASTGFYSATKFALEAVSEALQKEVEQFGIKVTIVEPGAFRTDFNGRSLAVAENKIPAYDSTQSFLDWLRAMDGKQTDDPRKATQAMIKIVKPENPPLRFLLEGDAIQAVESKIENIKADIAASRAIGIDTNFEGMQSVSIGG